MSKPTLLAVLQRIWPLGLVGLGWIGGQLVSPGARLTRLEAQQQISDSVLTEHIIWANTERNMILDRVNTLVRLKCIEEWPIPEKRRLLQAVDAGCEQLIGNNLPRLP